MGALEDGAAAPLGEGDGAALGAVAGEVFGEAGGESGSKAARFTSSLMPKERLSKFVEPTTLQTPSTTSVLAWIMDGWYS